MNTNDDGVYGTKGRRSIYVESQDSFTAPELDSFYLADLDIDVGDTGSCSKVLCIRQCYKHPLLITATGNEANESRNNGGQALFTSDG